METLAVVFVGSTLAPEAARAILPDADYRPPVRSGDLATIPAGAIVGIIDGVLEPGSGEVLTSGEVHEALARGVLVYGSSAFGARIAAENCGVAGIGRVYQLYRCGAICGDDEIAVAPDPSGNGALTVAMVNIRYGVERLVRSGTLNRANGAALTRAAEKLPIALRTYENIAQHSVLRDYADTSSVIQLLANFDLMREDAVFLLETIAVEKRSETRSRESKVERLVEGDVADLRAKGREEADADVMVWEYGDFLSFYDFVRFLKLTGAFEKIARRAVGRFAVSGAPLLECAAGGEEREDVQALLDSIRAEWGWESPEEAHVTMRDLGLGVEDVGELLDAESAIERVVTELAREPSEAFLKALRADLWLHRLSLKREALRFGALRYFATRGARSGPPSERELADARRSICRLTGWLRWSACAAALARSGVSDEEISSLTSEVALARRAGEPVVAAMERDVQPAAPPFGLAERWRTAGFPVEACRKADGSDRFSLPIDDAARVATGIGKQIGILRIELLHEGAASLGVQVAQAFGERSGWSSTFSSGKSDSAEGARVGSVMEEVEIQAQAKFLPRSEIRTSFARGRNSYPLIDPSTLDLPFDTRYSESLVIGWSPCFDLMTGDTVHMPSAGLLKDRVPNDIYYSTRLGAKIFSSSGLGSGFSLAEALVHASAECIERHALRLAEIQIDNPGELFIRPMWFVDLQSIPEGPRRLVERFRRAGKRVRVLDMTSDIRVPTFCAKVFDDSFETDASGSSDGFACHPNPAVALTMALLEAAQTHAGAIAGGRSDHSLKARSLGRHERARPVLRSSQMFWFSNDRPVRPFDATKGFCTRDILEELEFIVQRVRSAGYEHVLCLDLTTSIVKPAFAVRVIIPGTETTNQFFTGARARALSIREILPRRGADLD